MIIQVEYVTAMQMYLLSNIGFITLSLVEYIIVVHTTNQLKLKKVKKKCATNKMPPAANEVIIIIILGT